MLMRYGLVVVTGGEYLKRDVWQQRRVWQSPPILILSLASRYLAFFTQVLCSIPYVILFPDLYSTSDKTTIFGAFDFHIHGKGRLLLRRDGSTSGEQGHGKGACVEVGFGAAGGGDLMLDTLITLIEHVDHTYQFCRETTYRVPGSKVLRQSLAFAALQRLCPCPQHIYRNLDVTLPCLASEFCHKTTYRLPASRVNEGRIVWRIAQHVGWTYSEGHLVAAFAILLVEDCGLYYVWTTLPSCKGCTPGRQHHGAPSTATKYYCKTTYRVPMSKIRSIGGGWGAGEVVDLKSIGDLESFEFVRLSLAYLLATAPVLRCSPPTLLWPKAARSATYFAVRRRIDFRRARGRPSEESSFATRRRQVTASKGAHHRHVRARQGDDPLITQAPPAQTWRHVRARAFKHRRRRQDWSVLGEVNTQMGQTWKIAVYCQGGDHEYKGDNHRTPLTTPV
ncbi:hypothetical protein EDD18DRAFT_1105765 [Armillaria luteobubalina]|uniref:Uncharacterized protein n=1 Tax=Armillaria luteobubalina TaxID=153913 RepID=A0AA39Q449_9AGAR|nr:hypothetical protein EDD18DRAFT_1105765 [Armillaria luteobubalina]